MSENQGKKRAAKRQKKLDDAPPQAQSNSPDTPADKGGFSRRSFLGGVGGATVAMTAGGVLLPAITGSSSASAQLLPTPVPDRRAQAFRKRYSAAYANYNRPTASHPTNGDEGLYADQIGSYSKGLPHNAFGEPDLSAYAALLAACDSQLDADFEAIPSGCPTLAQRMKLVNPLGGVSYELEGQDCHDFTMRAAPAFASAEEAGEIVENYWMALLRDMPFASYGMSPLAAAACADLSALSDFRGPKVAGLVTPQTLFRESFPGVTTGPLISQFFWKSQPFGAQYIEPKIRTYVPSISYLTTPADWLARQNGFQPTVGQTYDPVRRYIRNGRDLSAWVHIDVLFQGYFQACLTLMTPPDPSDPITGGGIGCPFNPGNPYIGKVMTTGFGTFGPPGMKTLLCEVSSRALKTIWHQKWFVHRRLRPEEFGGRIHHKIVNSRPYPIHADALNSAGLAQVHTQTGNYFLPMAFPEGCPLHPAYGAGHATVAGACVTILKAIFDETFLIPNPVVASNDGMSLLPYFGGPLTVGGELNKIACNVAFGRNIAGVHWRTDGTESLKLGEELAISILRDQRDLYFENFNGYTFTKFDGTTITV